jgi:hypothetical protein
VSNNLENHSKMEVRIGYGNAIHRFGGAGINLRGIEIAFERGLLGHSHADCLCHVMIDGLVIEMSLPASALTNDWKKTRGIGDWTPYRRGGMLCPKSR